MKNKLINYLLVTFVVYMSAMPIVKAEALPKEMIKDLELHLQKEMKRLNLNKKRRYYVYVWAARELHAYGKYRYAKKYYEKAKRIDIDVNKSEVYINIVAIDASLGHKWSLPGTIKEAEEYFKNNPKYAKKLYIQMLKMRRMIELNDKSITDKDIELIAKNSLYAWYIKEHKLRKAIKAKKYKETLARLNPRAFQGINITEQLVYDVLHVLVIKRRVKKNRLFCTKKLKQYPKLDHYTMNICRILHDYIDTGKVANKQIKKLKDFFKNADRHTKKEAYLVEALQDLKKG